VSRKKKAVRRRFREVVFSRDGHRCRVCGASGKLDAHHVSPRTEMPSGGYVAENGVSLCPPCHLKAEDYFVDSPPRMLDETYSPEKLYELIGSSHERAVKASERLG
jgi:5-methylcytosine-specific restriction endonuclease McrA